MPRHRIDVREYYRMAELELLSPDARVELIEGSIVDMAPISDRQSILASRLDVILRRTVGDRGFLRSQMPLRLSEFSEPQPDLVLAKPRGDLYSISHPEGADTLLVIEIALTTLRYVREVKVPLYAAHGVPEVWVFDLETQQLHAYCRPRADDYADVSSTPTPGIMIPGSLRDLQIDLSGVMD